MSKNFTFLLLLCFYFSSQATKNKVDNLFDNLYSGDIYSGYLNTLIEENKLFYIYIPSQNKPDSDPLFLWLNGGPGCSSLFGLICEIGPVVLDPYSGELKENPYSWNKNANILTIDQPAGVGYSITNDSNYQWNDDLMGENLLTGLKDFINLFQLKGRPFYISGESYAGVYIPYLTTYILDDKSEDKINLKGILIGNGLADYETDIEISYVDFAFYRGIISPRTYKSYKENCPHLPDLLSPEEEIKNINDEEEPTLKDSFYPRNVTKKCNEIRETIAKNFQGIDIYGIYRQCPQKNNTNQNKVFSSDNHLTIKETIFKNLKKMSKKKYYLNKVNDEKEEELVEENDVFPVLCDKIPGDKALDNFLNNETIKIKLGIANISSQWEQCADLYYLMGDSINFYKNYIFNFPDLKVWVFSGNEDALLSTLGTLRWINKLNFTIETEWREWKAGEQVGGFVQKYKEGLVIATVNSAGHMVPQDQPEFAFKLVSSFLEGTLP